MPSGSASRSLRELYIGPGVAQYYLLPQVLVGPANQYAELDLVVRDSVQIPRYGLLHLSIVASTAVHLPADTLLLNLAGGPLAMPATRVLFFEPKGKMTLTRLEVYLTPIQTIAYLKSSSQSVLLGGMAGRRCFEPSKKSATALAVFASRVLGITWP